MRVLAAVFAHPDDETFATGGTVAKYAAEGARLALLRDRWGCRTIVRHPFLVSRGARPDSSRRAAGRLRRTRYSGRGARWACGRRAQRRRSRRRDRPDRGVPAPRATAGGADLRAGGCADRPPRPQGDLPLRDVRGAARGHGGVSRPALGGTRPASPRPALLRHLAAAGSGRGPAAAGAADPRTGPRRAVASAQARGFLRASHPARSRGVLPPRGDAGDGGLLRGDRRGGQRRGPVCGNRLGLSAAGRAGAYRPGTSDQPAAAPSISPASLRSSSVIPPASCVDSVHVTLVYRMSMSG